MNKLTTLLLALVLVAANAPLAQECDDVATAGNFEIAFEGTSFDGMNTTFTYCITGIDGEGFRALSNWLLSLDPSCIRPDDLMSCSGEYCGYQLDDPNAGLTGIKFDEIQVFAGETACYDFALAGDWTTRIEEVTVGLKAATDVSFASLCGPACVNCSLTMNVIPPVDLGEPVVLQLYLRHERPATVETQLDHAIVDATGQIVHQWTVGPLTMAMGDEYVFDGPIPELDTLAAGEYRLYVRMLGMNGWRMKSVRFEVPAAE